MAENALMSDPRKVGQKSRQAEEVKGGIDARDLIARFRSKSDIYEYLSQHSKISPFLLRSCLGQFYLPPKKKFTNDFIKQVFAG